MKSANYVVTILLLGPLAACSSGAATLSKAKGSTDVSIISADNSSLQIATSNGKLSAVNLDDATVLDYAAMVPGSGVVGIATDAADMPTTGTLNFEGTSLASIVENTAIFNLTGDATVILDAGAGSVDITLDNLTGDQIVGASVSNGMTNIVVSVEGATVCSGTSICGGTFDMSGSDSSAAAPAASDVSVSGGFFGPAAENVAGLITVQDTDNLTLSAGFVAEQPID